MLSIGKLSADGQSYYLQSAAGVEDSYVQHCRTDLEQASQLLAWSTTHRRRRSSGERRDHVGRMNLTFEVRKA